LIAQVRPGKGRQGHTCRAHWDPEFENLVKRQIVLAQRISPRRLAATLAGLNIAWPE
jgi:hypothetical protein